jgi:MFS family permease
MNAHEQVSEQQAISTSKLSELSENDLRRNFRFGVASGALGVMVNTIADSGLIITWFVSYLTASPVVIGLLLPLQKAGLHLPQLLVPGAAQRLPKKLPLWQALKLVGGLCWGLVAVLLFAFGGRNPSLVLIPFLVLYAIYWLTTGLSSVVGFHVVGKTISPQRRGAFFAWFNSGGALLTLASSALISYVLDEKRDLPFSTSFGILFCLAALGLGLSLLAVIRVKEPAEQTGDSAGTALVLFARIGQILRRDRNMALLLVAYTFQHLAGIAAPFFILYARDVLSAPDSLLGLLLAAATAISVVAALFWGWFSDRWGSRKAFVLSALLHIPAPLVPLIFGPRLHYLTIVPLAILAVFARLAFEIAPNKYILDIAPPADRMVYMGISNVVVGVVSLLYALGGFIVQQWGLYAVFVVATICPLFSLVFFWLLQDPAASKAAVVAGDKTP